MKTPHSPRGGRLILGIALFFGLIPQAFAETGIPRGTLCVKHFQVQIVRPIGDTKPLKEKYRTCLSTPETVTCE